MKTDVFSTFSYKRSHCASSPIHATPGFPTRIGRPVRHWSRCVQVDVAGATQLCLGAGRWFSHGNWSTELFQRFGSCTTKVIFCTGTIQRSGSLLSKTDNLTPASIYNYLTKNPGDTTSNSSPSGSKVLQYLHRHQFRPGGSWWFMRVTLLWPGTSMKLCQALAWCLFFIAIMMMECISNLPQLSEVIHLIQTQNTNYCVATLLGSGQMTWLAARTSSHDMEAENL